MATTSTASHTGPVPEALATLLPDDAEPLLIRFAEYWLSLRNGREMPTLKDIDPVDIPWALSAIFIVEKRAEDGLFAYRLAGEALASRLGANLKGKTAYDVFEAGYAEWTQGRWQKSVDERAACFVDTTHETNDRRPITARRLLFPLIGQSGAVDTLVGVGTFNRTLTNFGSLQEMQAARKATWVPVSSLK